MSKRMVVIIKNLLAGKYVRSAYAKASADKREVVRILNRVLWFFWIEDGSVMNE